ncbi:uncharacterized protein LOC143246618 [Tachypleus tridentatus]|uniref:uncharacterized protein LOC143246618 n=1 Tax=Tachypleus tridentatus TaxID=6853 RepID=UPI003FD1F853
MSWKATLLFAGLVWVTYCDSQEVYTPEYDIKTPKDSRGTTQEQTYHPQLNRGWFPYSFQYEVPIGQNGGYSHQESSNESGKVSGSYKIIGEDDNSRVVEYTADKNGFYATVRTNDPAVEGKNPADVTVMKDSTLFGLNTPNDNEGFPAVMTRQNGGARDIAKEEVDGALEGIGNSNSSYVIYLDDEDSQPEDEHYHNSHEHYGDHENYKMDNSHEDDHDMDNSYNDDNDMNNSYKDDHDMDNSNEDGGEQLLKYDEKLRKHNHGDTYNIYNSIIYLYNKYTNSSGDYYKYPDDLESAIVRYVTKYNSSYSLSDDANMTKQSLPPDVGIHPISNNNTLINEVTLSTTQATKHDTGDTYNIYNSNVYVNSILVDSDENDYTYPEDQVTSCNSLENGITDSTTPSTEAESVTTIDNIMNSTDSFISTFYNNTSTESASEATLSFDTRFENTTYSMNNASFSDIYFNNENETDAHNTTSWDNTLRENGTELSDHVTEPINNNSSQFWLNSSDELGTPKQETSEQSMASNRDNETTAGLRFGNETNHRIIFFPVKLGHLFNSSSNYATGNSPVTVLPIKTPSWLQENGSYPVYVPVHVSSAGNRTRKLKYGIFKY